MDGQTEPIRIARVGRVRGAGVWFLRWVAASAAIGAALVALTFARGGAVQRTVRPCGETGPDANLWMLALEAGALGAGLVLAWWAARAATARGRMARLAVAVAIGAPLAAAAVGVALALIPVCSAGTALRVPASMLHTVDGVTMTAERPCAPEDCTWEAGAARAALGIPASAVVVRVSTAGDGYYYGGFQSPFVVVLDLADGGRRAVEIICGPYGPPTAMPTPLVRDCHAVPSTSP